VAVASLVDTAVVVAIVGTDGIQTNAKVQQGSGSGKDDCHLVDLGNVDVGGSRTTVAGVGSFDPLAVDVNGRSKLGVEEVGTEDRHGLVKGKDHLTTKDVVVGRSPLLLLDDETFADVLFQVVIAGVALVRIKDARASPSVSGQGPGTHVDSVFHIADVVSVMELTKVNLLFVTAGGGNGAYQEGQQGKAHDDV